MQLDGLMVRQGFLFRIHFPPQEAVVEQPFLMVKQVSAVRVDFRVQAVAVVGQVSPEEKVATAGQVSS